jgi:hypothetical protein
MREDMSRVIVERPRLGGGWTKRGRTVPFSELPKCEGMRRPHTRSGMWKALNENLNPLRRYLERQVGRPWDKVYSEIARNLRPDSTVQQHVRDHVPDFVAIKSNKSGSTGCGTSRSMWIRATACSSGPTACRTPRSASKPTITRPSRRPGSRSRPIASSVGSRASGTR